jgi:hypothetical protein
VPPPLHDVPSAASGFEHSPVPVSHVPATWHSSDAEHTVGVPGAQAPDWQVSPVVQASPSSQLAVLFVKTQPVAGLHESSVQTLLSLQTMAVPLHEPPPHVSPLVQASPSSHETVLFVKTQPVAGLHVSVVHTLLSLQTIAVPLHDPSPQVSPLVQASPSSHDTVLFVKTQPVAGLQLSSVHGLLSSQTTGVPGVQVPPPQMSPLVQALPSSQGFVLSV